ncbi:MAG: aspartate dehydrogenase [Clostridiales bacterium]|nr:aspartate dehydrogenase [Clostridiales bacterium]
MFKNKNETGDFGEPVIRASICNGERVIGFRKDGKFIKGEIVRSDKDIVSFCKKYGIKREDVKTIY